MNDSFIGQYLNKFLENKSNFFFVVIIQDLQIYRRHYQWCLSLKKLRNKGDTVVSKTNMSERATRGKHKSARIATLLSLTPHLETCAHTSWIKLNSIGLLCITMIRSLLKSGIRAIRVTDLKLAMTVRHIFNRKLARHQKMPQMLCKTVGLCTLL